MRFLLVARPGDTVHLVKGASKTAPPPSQAQVPQNIQTGQQFAGNPLAPLLNATNPGIGNFNPFAEMGLNSNDPNMVQNMMNSPQAQEQMRTMLSNPAVIDQIIDSSPELRNMGPGVRQILQSDQFRNMLSNPQAMAEMARQAEQMRNNPMLSQLMGGAGGMGGLGALGGMGGGAADPWGAPIGGQQQQEGATQTQQNRGPTNLFNPQPQQGAGTTGTPSTGAAGAAPGQMPDFAALQQLLAGMGGMGAMGGMGGMGSPPTQPQQPQDSRPPEERYATQLEQLNEMGFVNPQANIRALLASAGNVQAAIEYILSQQNW